VAILQQDGEANHHPCASLQHLNDEGYAPLAGLAFAGADAQENLRRALVAAAGKDASNHCLQERSGANSLTEW